MAIKSTTKNQTENLIDVGVQVVENPFEIIAEHIHMAINTPHRLRLVRWIYGLCNLYDPLLILLVNTLFADTVVWEKVFMKSLNKIILRLLLPKLILKR